MTGPRLYGKRRANAVQLRKASPSTTSNPEVDDRTWRLFVRTAKFCVGGRHSDNYADTTG